MWLFKVFINEKTVYCLEVFTTLFNSPIHITNEDKPTIIQKSAIDNGTQLNISLNPGTYTIAICPRKITAAMTIKPWHPLK